MTRHELAFAALLFAVAAGPGLAQTSTDKTYAGGHFTLQIDGAYAGTLRSVVGGAKSKPIPGPRTVEPLAAVSAGAPLTVMLSSGVDKVILDWINSSWKGPPLNKSGMIEFCDSDCAARVRVDFYNAHLTEVTFPRADRAKTKTWGVALTFVPERVGTSQRAVRVLKTEAPVTGGDLQFTDFRLEVDGLPTTRITHIDAIRLIVGSSTVAGVGFTLPNPDADAWVRLMAKTPNGRSGRMVYFTPQATVLSVLMFQLTHIEKGVVTGATGTEGVLTVLKGTLRLVGVAAR